MRDPDTIMTLPYLGCSFPTRLSFMHTLLRRLNRENWQLSQDQWVMDDQGYGHAVYHVRKDDTLLSLVAFTQPLPDELRSDRVIAQAWDAAFVLFEGNPTTEDIERLRHNAPKQEAGRFTKKELVLSRANKSVRFFADTVDRLAQGLQPDLEKVQTIGYFMRTTAVYGNGKFGIADRDNVLKIPLISGAFAAEMLLVYLIRGFTHDLVEHIAFRRSPETAVKLAPEIKRHIGIGNSTGLGMAPFLATHPILLHHWISARETALARVCAIESVTSIGWQRFIITTKQAQQHVNEWAVADEIQSKRIELLKLDIQRLLEWLDNTKNATATQPWKALMDFASNQKSDFSIESIELTAALLINHYPELVDDLTQRMQADVYAELDPRQSAASLAEDLKNHYRWALQRDYSQQEELSQFWYVSESKAEPRVGNRYEETGAELEMRMRFGEEAIMLNQALAEFLAEKPNASVGHFLLKSPLQRAAVLRLQTVAQFPYAEIRDNLVQQSMRPIDLLRCKLSFFGASKFDPKSDRWTRITLYQGAPLRTEIACSETCPDWNFPALNTENK